MGLENVKIRVLEEAKAEAKSRIDAVNLESKKLLDQATSKMKIAEAEVKGQIKSTNDSIRKRENSSAKLESKKLLLNFKKEK